ncbi:hypothetical protein HUO09_17360 [Vibrio sp. Y2-5]|uniref:hypothetical protein n=1 Tax=Vibrio sp. Y2-5 TaxID=2743977 RepID=UPI0016604E52|nr:hypothetical protein [Vibrio sp. Y2-5]MBD0788125.1 hypothetical protein [Vibrio sp. Y2-5]
MRISTSDSSLIVTFEDCTLKITDTSSNVQASLFHWTVTKVRIQQQLFKVSKSVSFKNFFDNTMRHVLFQNKDLKVEVVQEKLKALTITHLTFNDSIVVTLNDWETICKAVEAQVQLSMRTNPTKFEALQDQMMESLKKAINN